VIQDKAGAREHLQKQCLLGDQKKSGYISKSWKKNLYMTKIIEFYFINKETQTLFRRSHISAAVQNY